MSRSKPYALKSFLDFVLVIIIFIPVHIVIGLILVLYLLNRESPMFFKQQRSGLNGRLFSIYKFRTLNSDSETTKLGRVLRLWSLDELPQIWNIVRGDMSFVGPRPLLPEYFNKYSPEQKQRLLVKPGITGLAQVNGRNALSWDKKFYYDLQYIRNSSLWLDVSIILKTVIFCVKSEDIEPQFIKRFDQW